MDLTLDAATARTADGLDHLSHLVVPAFGVVGIRLKAGAKLSKSRRPQGAVTPRTPWTDGEDSFNFAPGPQMAALGQAPDDAKTDPVELILDLYNPCMAIGKAKLQIFRRFETKPVWERELKNEELFDGEQTLKFGDKATWDGAIDKTDDFPDGFLTVEHSPYQLRLSVEGTGTCQAHVAWTYFHVLVAKLELEYGPKEAAPNTTPPDHRKVLKLLTDQGAKPPTGTAKVKVFLESNVFKKGHSMFDNSLFDTYKTLWDEGPQIPLFATIRVKTSDAKEVLAPKALGKARFLWDWESKREATSRDFVDKAQDFDKDTTKPKGQNSHFDRGGKRGGTANSIFPAHAGYDPKDTLDDGVFPFKVEAITDTRKWSAWSYAWRDKKLACQTGVMFQPSRMAGDAYVLRVYLSQVAAKDGKRQFNVTDDAPLTAPATITVASGIFEVWRKVHFVGYKRKTAAVPALSVASIPAFHTPAFLDFEDTSGGVKEIDATTWNNALKTGRSSLSQVGQMTIDHTVNQHGKGPMGVYFRTRDKYREWWRGCVMTAKMTGAGFDPDSATADAINYTKAYHASKAEPTATVIAGTPPTGQATLTNLVAAGFDGGQLKVYKLARLAGKTPDESRDIAAWAKESVDDADTFIDDAANGVETDAKYANVCEGRAIRILEAVFDAHFAAAEGVNLFHVDQTHNLVLNQTNITFGLAADFPSGSDRKCAFFYIASDASLGLCSIAAAKKTDIFAHEVGHHLMLPHTPGIDSGADGTVGYKAHEQGATDCMMSYNYGVAWRLCGFCQLRLRGWDKSKIDVDGTKNKKP